MQDFIKELQDLRYLDWVNKKMSIGTPGCFLKAYEETNEGRIYYKMSNYDSYRGIFGHECVNELIVSRLLDILEIPHLEYQLVFAKLCINEQEMEGYISKSVNFRKENEKKMVFDTYYELYCEKKESPLDFAKRCGWEQYVYQMFVVDYLICNRDRHGANIEVLVDEKEKPRLAPLFDHGLSLLFSCYNDLESVRKFDILEDRAVNNFIGSKSLEYNLGLIPKGQIIFSGKLKEEDKEILVKELEQTLPKEHLDKIWVMIWERWKKYVEICH
ncbi:MAG: hypothetical protein NC419_13260 [Muribaculaceae bacterium]|nr:hypothetical protein [Muribaculaceae bacterium]